MKNHVQIMQVLMKILHLPTFRWSPVLWFYILKKITNWTLIIVIFNKLSLQDFSSSCLYFEKNL